MSKTKLPRDYLERTRAALRNMVRLSYLVERRGLDALFPEEIVALNSVLSTLGKPFTKTDRRSRLRTARRLLVFAYEQRRAGDMETYEMLCRRAVAVLGFSADEVIHHKNGLDPSEWERIGAFVDAVRGMRKPKKANARKANEKVELLSDAEREERAARARWDALRLREMQERRQWFRLFEQPDTNDMELWAKRLELARVPIGLPITALDKVRIDTWFSESLNNGGAAHVLITRHV